jgi:hypothetical protein
VVHALIYAPMILRLVSISRGEIMIASGFPSDLAIKFPLVNPVPSAMLVLKHAIRVQSPPVRPQLLQSSRRSNFRHPPLLSLSLLLLLLRLLLLLHATMTTIPSSMSSWVVPQSRRDAFGFVLELRSMDQHCAHLWVVLRTRCAQ